MAKAEEANEAAAESVRQRDAAIQASAAAGTMREGASQALEAVRGVEAAASTLKVSVDAYQETFTGFQGQLETRNEAFKAGKAELDRLTTSIAETEVELQRMVDKSRTVLGEATVSGLSDRFANEANEIGKRLSATQWGLVVSVVALFVSAILVLKFPSLVSGQPAVGSAGSSPTDTWSAVAVFLLSSTLGKLILLLPAIFLVVFTAKRASDLFHLRAAYTYKYTVAASLPGFKEEAPDHAQAITAVAFKELLYNPAAEDGAARRRKNTWLERLLEPKIRTVLEKMLKDTDKGS